MAEGRREGHEATGHRAARGMGHHDHFLVQDDKTEENNQGVEEEKDIFSMKTFVVFNVEQVVGEGLDVFRIGHSPIQPRTPFVVYEEADRVIEATVRTSVTAATKPSTASEDFIQVPLREQFRRRNIMKRSCMSFAIGVSPA